MVISVYPGLVLRYQYDGYSMRTGSDLVWLNCEADRDAFVQMCAAFGLNSDGARVFGIPSLLQSIERPKDASNGPVVFFEQAVIPRYHDERLFLAQKLIQLSRKYPKLTFLIKARTLGDNTSLHRTWHPIDRLLKEVAQRDGGMPKNLSLTAESASQLLAKASHCLTISSTVAAEAISAKIPTAIISDFGAHEDYGLPYFFSSGLMRRLDDLKFPFDQKPSIEWQSRFITDPKRTVDNLVVETIQLAGEPRQSMAERSPNSEMSPELRQFLIQRNGVENVLLRRYQVRKHHRSVLTKMWSGVIRRFRP
ncbi:hypothetical protein P6U16_22630 (plasmid) [Rhizobium sp. 32-5/1]|nr:DUF6716 putative glycosyltransferase [Rhizobium sp. 32-5/1]WEZ85816.1 hypothetical protein P6U16_22630 [Rhizobium sp. 32-5/1]